MALLHDSAVRSAIEGRLERLRSDSKAAWGSMSVDQRLWHVNQALASALGQVDVPQEKAPLPRPVMKFMVLNVPWPKGAPTNPAFAAKAQYDFEAERIRCRRLIGELVSRGLDQRFADHPMLGRMSGRDVSRLHAKHLDHHLRQFGV